MDDRQDVRPEEGQEHFTYTTLFPAAPGGLPTDNPNHSHIFQRIQLRNARSSYGQVLTGLQVFYVSICYMPFINYSSTKLFSAKISKKLAWLYYF